MSTPYKHYHRMKTVLITGAAGNLGGLLADHLKEEEDINLHLLYHYKTISANLLNRSNIKAFQADLADKSTLMKPLEGVDTIVHFAGVLFKANPEKFLPLTNTTYFKNLTEVAVSSGVKRIILISFPHVEGESFPDSPACGTLDGTPTSSHARTRLEEEKILFGLKAQGIETISLRVGMVYGKGILMIDTARWFSKHHLLGVWTKPTWIHLISTVDFLESTRQAILKDGVCGIYHLGDDGKQTLQEFLDLATAHWGYRKPIRMPVGVILFAASCFEFFSKILGTRSPLTRDFIKIGMASYYGDTKRARQELHGDLKYKTVKEGLETL